MLSERNTKIINLILLVFSGFDLVYSLIVFFFPEAWFKTIHGVAYADTQGLFQRTGAIWASFTLFQLMAYFKWKQKPYWLALVAGLRLSELVADWTYLYFAHDLSLLGWAGLFISTPTNMLVSWVLFKAFLAIDQVARGPKKPPQKN